MNFSYNHNNKTFLRDADHNNNTFFRDHNYNTFEGGLHCFEFQNDNISLLSCSSSKNFYLIFVC